MSNAMLDFISGKDGAPQQKSSHGGNAMLDFINSPAAPQSPGIKPQPKWQAGGIPKQQGSQKDVIGTASPGDKATAVGIRAGTRNFLIGSGAGILKTAKGAQQVAATAGDVVGIRGAGAAVKRLSDERHQIDTDIAPLLKESTAANVGQFVGEAAPMAVLPGGVAGGAAKRALTAGLAGGIQGAVMDADNPGTGAVEGAALGAGASGVMSGLGTVANAVTGKVPESLTKTLGDKFGIRTTLAEETTGAPSKLDVKMEALPGPFGTHAFRRAQQEDAQNAAKTYLGRYVADPTAGDVEQANRSYVSGLYDKVKDLVIQVPKQEISANDIRTAGKELLDTYPDIFKRLQDTKTEAVIQDIVHGTERVTTSTPASSVLNAAGEPMVPALSATTPKTLTFDEAWALRQGLGEKIGQLRKLETRGEVDRTAVSQMQKLFGTVSDTLDKWTGDIGKPEIRIAFKAANEAYKDNVVRYRIVQDAYDKALNVEGDHSYISPQKFSTSLKKIIAKNKYEKNFTPDQVAEMTGLMNIMQTVKRAGQFMENPPTGNRWGLPTVGAMVEGAAYNAAGAAGAVKTAGLAGAAALTTRWLTTTPAGKKLALAASKLNPEGVAMRRILDQVYQQVPKFAVEAGLAGGGDSKEHSGEGMLARRSRRDAAKGAVKAAIPELEETYK